MALKNSCRFTGRLGQDPDLQYTPSGIAIVKTSLAVNEQRKQDDEYIEETTWVNLTAFGKAAETMAKMLNKGDLIQVDTQYQVSQYEKDGETKYRHNFIVREWDLLRRKYRGEEHEVTNSSDEESDDEEFPF